MSQEILEFSVQVDEKFDLKFNWLDGFFWKLVSLIPSFNH